jgi:hypothetical protein
MAKRSSSNHQELYIGLVRLHALHHAAHEPIFGMGLIRELARHGYRLGRWHHLPAASRHGAARLGSFEDAVSGQAKKKNLQSNQGRPRCSEKSTRTGSRALGRIAGKCQLGCGVGYLLLTGQGKNSVYDTRTIDSALWHFWHFNPFLESASYRIHEVWKSSTPAASTNSC